jgi:hypothetical protein
MLGAQTAIRQRIRLRKPSLPTEKIDTLYSQQLCVLDSIPDYDERHDSLIDPKWAEMCKDKVSFCICFKVSTVLIFLEACLFGRDSLCT